MKAMKMHEAKTNFSRLIGLVEAGEEIIVQRDDHPVAKIVPYPSDAHARKAGALKGQITIADDFDRCAKAPHRPAPRLPCDHTDFPATKRS